MWARDWVSVCAECEWTRCSHENTTIHTDISWHTWLTTKQQQSTATNLAHGTETKPKTAQSHYLRSNNQNYDSTSHGLAATVSLPLSPQLYKSSSPFRISRLASSIKCGLPENISSTIAKCFSCFFFEWWQYVNLGDSTKIVSRCLTPWDNFQKTW